MQAQAVAGDGVLAVDDTAYLRQGQWAIGAAHQYCGALGKTANCQVAVTTHYVDPYYAWPVNGRLYLPETWCQDAERRRRAEVPADVVFETKPALALELIDQAHDMGVPFHLVVSDGGYGDNPNFLDGLEARHLRCVVRVHSDFGVRLPQEVAEAAKEPLPAKKKTGRPRVHPHPAQVAPLRRVDEVIADQAETAWQTVTWRRGSDGPLSKQFVAVRVHRAVGKTTGREGWLLAERPLPDHEGDHKYYWSDLPTTTPVTRLAELAHRRPAIERGYQDGKGFTGLDHYPARRWHSFHRHLAIEMLVLSWLLLQRPPVEKPVIVVDPQPVKRSDESEPVFPLRPRCVPEHRTDPTPGERFSAQGANPMADSQRPDRHYATPWSATAKRLPGAAPRPIALR
jgi:SRSO17 transposase